LVCDLLCASMGIGPEGSCFEGGIMKSTTTGKGGNETVRFKNGFTAALYHTPEGEWGIHSCCGPEFIDHTKPVLMLSWPELRLDRSEIRGYRSRQEVVKFLAKKMNTLEA
jgi:hypothetical protein